MEFNIYPIKQDEMKFVVNVEVRKDIWNGTETIFSKDITANYIFNWEDINLPSKIYMDCTELEAFNMFHMEYISQSELTEILYNRKYS